MSKLQLKKELQGMTAQQLREVILEVYSSKPQAKEYFEFFLNPDAKALLERYRMAVHKEVFRSGGRLCKARVSRVNAAIRDFRSFRAGAEYVVDLLLWAVEQIIRAERVYVLTPTQAAAAEKWLAAALKEADACGRASEVAADIDQRLLSPSGGGSLYFLRRLAESLQKPQA